jgi:hypothetical protein
VRSTSSASLDVPEGAKDSRTAENPAALPESRRRGQSDAASPSALSISHRLRCTDRHCQSTQGGLCCHDRGIKQRRTCGIQIANMVGATPIAVTRTSAKKQTLLEFGAAHVIASKEKDLEARLKEIAWPRGRTSGVRTRPVAHRSIFVSRVASALCTTPSPRHSHGRAVPSPPRGSSAYRTCLACSSFDCPVEAAASDALRLKPANSSISRAHNLSTAIAPRPGTTNKRALLRRPSDFAGFAPARQ